MRDHSCEAPFCIKRATATCGTCFLWLCPDHLKDHDCTKLNAWKSDAPVLNVLADLKPDSVTAEEDWRKKWR